MGRKKDYEKKSLIWHTAYDLFVEKGYKNVTINEIAAASGVSNNLVPHYFKKSDEFLVDIFEFVTKTAENFAWKCIKNDLECMEFIRENVHITRPLLFGLSNHLLLNLFLRDNEKLFNLYGAVFFHMELSSEVIQRLFSNKSSTMVELYQRSLITPVERPEDGIYFLFTSCMAMWTLYYQAEARRSYRAAIEYRSKILESALSSFCKMIEIPTDEQNRMVHFLNRLVNPGIFEDFYNFYVNCIDEYLSS